MLMSDNNSTYILACDIGGTHITSAIVHTRTWEILSDTISRNVVNSNSDDATRFLILSNDIVEQKSANKASLSFQTGNAVGSLAAVLQCFAEQHVNLSKIQSMPVVGRLNG